MGRKETWYHSSATPGWTQTQALSNVFLSPYNHLISPPQSYVKCNCSGVGGDYPRHPGMCTVLNSQPFGLFRSLSACSMLDPGNTKQASIGLRKTRSPGHYSESQKQVCNDKLWHTEVQYSIKMTHSHPITRTQFSLALHMSLQVQVVEHIHNLYVSVMIL